MNKRLPWKKLETPEARACDSCGRLFYFLIPAYVKGEKVFLCVDCYSDFKAKLRLH